jgi:hypothetical protein
MRTSAQKVILSNDHWCASDNEVSDELQSFIEEFGSFTPEWFAEVKFHLIRETGLTRESRDELCELSIDRGHCKRCDSLYEAKECPLWFRLFRLIRLSNLQRSPPCVRLAYTNGNIRHAADFLARAGVITPPFYRAKMAPRCGGMRRWGYCRPDQYCEAMETANTLEYTAAREHVKISRPVKRIR